MLCENTKTALYRGFAAKISHLKRYFQNFLLTKINYHFTLFLIEELVRFIRLLKGNNIMAKRKATTNKKGTTAKKKGAATTTTTTAARKSTKSREVLAVASKVKAALKSSGCNTAGDAMEGLNDVIHWYLDQAAIRAKANGRKTVRRHDFIS